MQDLDRTYNIKRVQSKDWSDLMNATTQWIKEDFIKSGAPEIHFWYGPALIIKAFKDLDVLVCLHPTDPTQTIGYLVYTYRSTWPEKIWIDIVEVHPHFRRKGVATALFNNLRTIFPLIQIIQATPVTEKGKLFLESRGMKRLPPHPFYSTKRASYYRIYNQMPSLASKVPTGLSVALCSTYNFSKKDAKYWNANFYAVQANKKQFECHMKYYPLCYEKDAKLIAPLVTFHDPEGYIGVFYNGRLLEEGKLKHLMQSGNRARVYSGAILSIRETIFQSTVLKTLVKIEEALRFHPDRIKNTVRSKIDGFLKDKNPKIKAKLEGLLVNELNILIEGAHHPTFFGAVRPPKKIKKETQLKKEPTP